MKTELNSKKFKEYLLFKNIDLSDINTFLDKMTLSSYKKMI